MLKFTSCTFALIQANLRFFVFSYLEDDGDDDEYHYDYETKKMNTITKTMMMMIIIMMAAALMLMLIPQSGLDLLLNMANEGRVSFKVLKFYSIFNFLLVMNRLKHKQTQSSSQTN